MFELHHTVASAGGIYKTYSSRLEKLGIIYFRDFLSHIPTRYEDYRNRQVLNSITPGETVSVLATVLSLKNTYLKSYKTIQKALVTDGSATLEITWFNQPYLLRQIKTNDVISLAGRVEQFAAKLVMQSPEFELVIPNQKKLLHTFGLVPVYQQTRGVSSKWLRRQIFALLSQHAFLNDDFLPEALRQQYNLFPLPDALVHIHFPPDYETAAKARERLAFDELLLLQLQSLHRRTLWRQTEGTQPLLTTSHQAALASLLSSLPFQLTISQQQSLETILTDMTQAQPMNRLLQGDVGSGKTIVAAICMYIAVLNKKQAVIMAPTEILAEQHFTTLKKLLEPLGVRIQLITGGTKKETEKGKKTTRKRAKKPLAAHILVGTHALLYDKATFPSAGLVVIDEQQRFGVEQRALMREKGSNPHVLTMTATPIPRTIALTVYGDLDVSSLDQMPKGRRYVKTWLVSPEKRENAYEWIKKQLETTESQAFLICPFIEESENMQTIKAATVEYTRLQQEVFPTLKLGLLHGKMKAKEKERVLLDFRNKKYAILVATPVVEVGIDIPNATIIVIEASERFGLSQLHQLRGRVGRGEKQSYCLLFTESKNQQTIERLKSLEAIHEGKKLAELDLKLRGSGDIYGTLQSGYQLLKIASFSDSSLIEQARQAAKDIYKNLTQYPSIQRIVEESGKRKIAKD